MFPDRIIPTTVLGLRATSPGGRISPCDLLAMQDELYLLEDCRDQNWRENSHTAEVPESSL
jgi:hypothetical protein